MRVQASIETVLFYAGVLLLLSAIVLFFAVGGWADTLAAVDALVAALFVWTAFQ